MCPFGGNGGRALIRSPGFSFSAAAYKCAAVLIALFLPSFPPVQGFFAFHASIWSLGQLLWASAKLLIASLVCNRVPLIWRSREQGFTICGGKQWGSVRGWRHAHYSEASESSWESSCEDQDAFLSLLLIASSSSSHRLHPYILSFYSPVIVPNVL